MKKSDAIEIFGTKRALIEAMDISRQALHQWPDELDQVRTDKIIGAAIRCGKFKEIKKFIPSLPA